MPGNNQFNVSSHWPITIATSLSSVLNVLLPLILTRILDIDSIGAYKLLFLYLGFIPWLTMSGALMQSLYAYSNNKDFSKVYSSSAILILTFSVLLIVLFSFNHLLGLFQLPIPKEHFVLLLLAILSTSLNPLLEEVLISRSSIKKAAVIILLFDSTRVLSMIFSALYFRDIYHVILAFVVLGLVKVFYGFYESSRLKLFSKPSADQIKSLVYFAAPLSFAGALSVLTTQGDQLIISHYVNLQDYTFYAMGCLLLPFLSSFEQSVNKVLFSDLVSHQLDKKFSIESLQKSISEISSILIPASIGLSTFASPIVKILYTAQYEKASEYLKFYAFFYLLLIIPFDLVTKVAKKTRSVLMFYAVGSVMGLSSSFILIPYWGTWGALFSLFLGQIAMRLFGFAKGARILKCSVAELFPWAQVSKYLGTSVVLSLLALVLKGFIENEIYWFLISGPVFFVIYFMLHLRKRWFKPIKD